MRRNRRKKPDEREPAGATDASVKLRVYPNMAEHGWERDDWPELYAKVETANILVIGSPICLGEKSSVRTKIIERLYSTSGDLNDAGQYAYYPSGTPAADLTTQIPFTDRTSC